VPETFPINPSAPISIVSPLLNVKKIPSKEPSPVLVPGLNVG
jgi:hypothetical protein